MLQGFPLAALVRHRLGFRWTWTMVIAIVALVVIGPERLPRVARTAGLLFGRLQRYVNDVKSDISREIQLDELKRLQSEMQESARSLEQSIAGEIGAIEKDVGQAVESARAAVAGEIPAAGKAPPDKARE